MEANPINGVTIVENSKTQSPAHQEKGGGIWLAGWDQLQLRAAYSLLGSWNTKFPPPSISSTASSAPNPAKYKECGGICRRCTAVPIFSLLGLLLVCWFWILSETNFIGIPLLHDNVYCFVTFIVARTRRGRSNKFTTIRNYEYLNRIISSSDFQIHRRFINQGEIWIWILFTFSQYVVKYLFYLVVLVFFTY